MTEGSHGPGVVVDTPGPEDAERIAQMLVDDMTELGFSPASDEMLQVVSALIAHDGDAYYIRVARDTDGVAAGVLLANAFTSIKYPGRALWIEELYVDPERRRGGVGRVLVADLLEWASAHGIRGIELEAYRMNTAASVLYRTMGFRRLARERYAFDMSEYEQP